MIAAANILNLLRENKAIHFPILIKILSDGLFSLLTLISLEQKEHFQLVLGKEYPNMSKMILNFQLTNMRPTYKISNKTCWVDYGTGSNLHT